MKKMWIQLKEVCDVEEVKRELSKYGRLEEDTNIPHRFTLTFRNQSEDAMHMAGYELSQDLVHSFEDFDMIWEAA